MPPHVTTRSSDDCAQAVEIAAALIAERWPRLPQVGIVLGTGLGGFAHEIAGEATIPYDDLAGFPRATAVGHKGQLTCGDVGGVPVIAMEGRFHLYEGYTAQQITLPIRVMQRLGIKRLIISNAAGAVNPNFRVGDVMLIADHINLMGTNPLSRETNSLPVRYTPHAGRPYDSDLIAMAERIARRCGFACHRGVYVGLSGPNYETRAEYRFLRQIGGDVIGMSTVPEAILAHQLGLRVLAVSTVTNVCRPDDLSSTDGQQVVDAAAASEPKLRAIVCGVTAACQRRPQ